MRFLAVAVLWALSAPGGAHETVKVPELPAELARTLRSITGKRIVEHARELCDPDYQGRRAGRPGGRLAAEHIADQFRKIGLRPGGAGGGYYQTFKISAGYIIKSRLSATLGRNSLGDFARGSDYAPIHLPGGKADFDGECVLAGYGVSNPQLKFDEYAGLQAKGRAVIVFSGVPWSPRTAGWIRRAGSSEKFDSLAYKAQNALKHGASCLLVAENPAGWRREVAINEQLRITEGSQGLNVSIPVVQITRDMLCKLTSMSRDELRLMAAEINRERKPQSTLLRGRKVSLRASAEGSARVGRNVIGILPGRDEKLRTECVVLGAHHDHLGAGEKGIYFGANDNAAGVGALIEIARAHAAMPRPPRRTLVFVAFDAEEIGKLGSRHYLSRPPISIAKTVLMINFDMIGRNAEDEINAVGTLSSPELHRLHQEANRHVGLKLVHPASYRLGRSDHTAFYYAGVPIMYLFGGLDPDYNTPRDTCDKLKPAKLEKVARLALLTSMEVAERRGRISFRRAREHSFIPVPSKATRQ